MVDVLRIQLLLEKDKMRKILSSFEHFYTRDVRLAEEYLESLTRSESLFHVATSPGRFVLQQNIGCNVPNMSELLVFHCQDTSLLFVEPLDGLQ